MSWACGQKTARDLEPLPRVLARLLRYPTSEETKDSRPQGWCRVTEVVAQPFMQQWSEDELVTVILERLDAEDSKIFFYVDEPYMWAAYLDPEKDLRKDWWNCITQEWFYVEGSCPT